jgi:hypothetical protein
MNERRCPSPKRYNLSGQFFASLGNLKHSLETDRKRPLRRLFANAVKRLAVDVVGDAPLLQSAQAVAAGDHEDLSGTQGFQIEFENAKLEERLDNGFVTEPAKLCREDAGVGLRSRYKEAHTSSSQA